MKYSWNLILSHNRLMVLLEGLVTYYAWFLSYPRKWSQKIVLQPAATKLVTYTAKLNVWNSTDAQPPTKKKKWAGCLSPPWPAASAAYTSTTLSILRRIILRTAGFIMHIFATCFQAITVQSNCYANFALIKGQCEAWEVSFFRVHFQATVIRTCSLCRMKKKNLRLQPIKRRVSLAWKPNWLPYHHVLKLWLTGLTPGQALDQLCHRIQTSKKIFCQRKTLTCSTQQ